MTLLDAATWQDRFLSDVPDRPRTSSPIVEPATGANLGSYLLASVEDVHAAATRAAEVQREWALTPPETRAAILRKAGELFEEHAAEIQVWIVRETGAIAPKAGLETHIAAQECFEGSALPTAVHGDVIPTELPRWSFARRRPAGVVSVISPFNFPLILSIRSVAAALALGNAVLLKPDPRTTVSGGVSIARVFEEAGLPAGLLHLLPGGLEIGQAVVSAPEVRIVSFTGSTPAGRAVGELAAKHLKRAHLELGGNNALVVFPGADVAAAASAGAFGSFMHQGQICMSTGRHLVHESIAEEYVAALAAKAEGLVVGDPTGQVHLGPIIDSNQLNRVHSIVEEAKAAGASVAAGGSFDQLFYRPTVLANVGPGNAAWDNEIFGPVAPVTTFKNKEEALEIIALSPFGLSVGILGDIGSAMWMADRLCSGKVHINEQTVMDEANAPFGGMGDSGTGSRFGGQQANIEAFTETQWLTMRPEIAPYPF